MNEWPLVTYADSQEQGSPRRKGFPSRGRLGSEQRKHPEVSQVWAPSRRLWISNPFGTRFISPAPSYLGRRVVSQSWWAAERLGLNCFLQSLN